MVKKYKGEIMKISKILVLMAVLFFIGCGSENTTDKKSEGVAIANTAKKVLVTSNSLTSKGAKSISDFYATKKSRALKKSEDEKGGGSSEVVDIHDALTKASLNYDFKNFLYEDFGAVIVIEAELYGNTNALSFLEQTSKEASSICGYENGGMVEIIHCENEVVLRVGKKISLIIFSSDKMYFTGVKSNHDIGFEKYENNLKTEYSLNLPLYALPQ